MKGGDIDTDSSRLLTPERNLTTNARPFSFILRNSCEDTEYQKMSDNSFHVGSPSSKRSSRLNFFRRLSSAAYYEEKDFHHSPVQQQDSVRLSKKLSINSCNSETSNTNSNTNGKHFSLRPLFSRSKSSLTSEKCDLPVQTPLSIQSVYFQQNYLFAKATQPNPKVTTVDDFADTDSEMEDEPDAEVITLDSIIERTQPGTETIHEGVFEEIFDDEEERKQEEKKEQLQAPNEQEESSPISPTRPQLSVDTDLTHSRDRLENMKSAINSSVEFLGSSLYLPDNIINENEEQPNSPIVQQHQQQEEEQEHPEPSISPISYTTNSVISKTHYPLTTLTSPDSHSPHISFSQETHPAKISTSTIDLKLDDAKHPIDNTKHHINNLTTTINKAFLADHTRVSICSVAGSSSSCIDNVSTKPQQPQEQPQKQPEESQTKTKPQMSAGVGQNENNVKVIKSSRLFKGWIRRMFSSQQQPQRPKRSNAVSVN